MAVETLMWHLEVCKNHDYSVEIFGFSKYDA